MTLGGNNENVGFFIIDSDGDTLFTFRGDGKLGIGTFAPSELLEIRLYDEAESGGLLLHRGDNRRLYLGWNFNGGYIDLWGDDDEIVNINPRYSHFTWPHYRLGIGTSTPSEQLEITGNFNLAPTTSADGIIKYEGEPYIHSFGTSNFFAGKHAGNLITSGAGGNTGVGVGALSNNTTGEYNTATGRGALTFNTTGFRNTAFGDRALSSNTSGAANTATGYLALHDNTEGIANTATGAGALQSNTTGYSNTATGNSALHDNTEGEENTATGRSALSRNTTGSYNTATGSNALNFNTTGDKNTATGYCALHNNTSGYWNTATGHEALYNNTTGLYNTANGRDALYDNINGNSNTATGYGALRNNNTGSFNTAIGGMALAANTHGNANTAIGDGALFENSVGIYNTATGVGALQQNTEGRYNTAAGHLALFKNKTGNNNIAIGRSSLYNNTTGSLNTAIGYYADVTSSNLTNATAIGFDAKVNASNKIRLGNNAVTVIAGKVDFTVDSDSTKKENFIPTDGKIILEKIKEFRLGSWNFKDQDPNKFRHYGPMAQDFFAAFGHDGIGTIGTDTTICGSDINGINMIAIQALENRTAELKDENRILREKIEHLENNQVENVILKKQFLMLNDKLNSIIENIDADVYKFSSN